MKRIVDISRAQGLVNFATMRAQGVEGVIMRLCHGLTLDTMVDTYYPAALAAGYLPTDIGFYPFINPKRGSAVDSAQFAARELTRITGSMSSLVLGAAVGVRPAAGFYMLDVENYRDQSPDVGQAPVTGQAFADWLRTHIAEFRRLMPETYVIAYSNASFWNGPDGPKDASLAAELEWIVPRYPVNSTLGYAKWPLPGPDGWEQWAFARSPQGPLTPLGGKWYGWQFSAGYNHQAARYGASSTDLDLNIIDPAAWARWTTRVIPSPPQEDDMAEVLVNRDVSPDGKTPPFDPGTGGWSVWRMNEKGFKRAIGLPEFYACGYINGTYKAVPLDWASLNAIPDAPADAPPSGGPPAAGWPVHLDVDLNAGTAQGRVG